MDRNQLFNRLEQSLLTIDREIYQSQLKLSEFSPAQNHVLMTIDAHQPIGIKQLAQLLGVTFGAVTQHIDTLEKIGLLNRKMGASDRREVVVAITKDGRTVCKNAYKVKSQVLNKISSSLSDRELITLVKLIEKISHNNIKGAINAKS